MTSSTPGHLTDLHHVGLTVSDIERSIAFYRDVLGMTLIRRRETDADYIGTQTGFPGVKLAAASFKVSPDSEGSMEIVQYLSHAGEPVERGTNRAGSSHICFTVNDIQSTYDALRAKGVPFKSEPVAITSGPNEGGYVAYLHDPDGYTLEVFQPPPG